MDEKTTVHAFAKEVLRFVPRANGDEWYEIAHEITAHLEDRADALEARGMTHEEAQAEAVRRMGDPKEIGQALNAELSVFWGWVGRITAIVITLAVVSLFLPLLCMLGYALGNLNARFFVDFQDFSPRKNMGILYEEERNERFDANGSTVTFHGYRVYQEPSEYILETYVSSYAHNPFDEVDNNATTGFTLDGEHGHGGGGGGYTYTSRFPIAKGDTDFVLARDKYGVSWETTLTMDWEGIA